MNTARFVIASPSVAAVVDGCGSELVSITDAAGRELLWDGGPQWPWHAPLLFPTIGRVVDDEIEHDGRRYPMPRHGFGRDQLFDLIEKTPTSTHLQLVPSPTTKEHFPFDFVLDVRHSVTAASVTSQYTVTNISEVTLPVSLGVHPAFPWPAGQRDQWRIELDTVEDGQAYHLADVLLADTTPNPVRERTLDLAEELFATGALVLIQCRSTSLRLLGPDMAITLSWDGFEHITVWSPVDADLLCVEPWSGYPSPVGFEADILGKPGQQLLAPGEHRTWSYTITVE